LPASNNARRLVWSEADLIRRLCRTLDFAAKAVAMMAAEGFTDPDDASRSIRAEKVVGETALLLLSVGTATADPDVRARTDALARALIPYARGERVRARTCLEPSLALEHALAHICLSGLGYPDPELDALLADSLAADSAGGCERSPYRQLEQDWLLRTWGGLPDARTDPSLARRSALGRPTDLLSLRKDDVYAFTHAMLYLTDLGRRRVRMPRPAAELEAEADAALAVCLDELDYDLGGEVLFTWAHLHRSWSATATLGFAVVAEVDDRLGFLPSPGVSLAALAGLTGEARDRYLVPRSYHTVFVMGLLCAALLRSGRLPPIEVADDGRYGGAATELMNLMGSPAPNADWARRIDGLTPGQRDSLAPLLVNIALRRATARRDFTGLRAILLAAGRYGLLHGPAPWQAAQLLQRAARLSATSRAAAE
jgi:hypothetical protein